MSFFRRGVLHRYTRLTHTLVQIWIHLRVWTEKSYIGCRSSNKSFPFFAVHPRVMSSRLNSSSKFSHGAMAPSQCHMQLELISNSYISKQEAPRTLPRSGGSILASSPRDICWEIRQRRQCFWIWIYSSLTIRFRLVFVCNNKIEIVKLLFDWHGLSKKSVMSRKREIFQEKRKLIYYVSHIKIKSFVWDIDLRFVTFFIIDRIVQRRIR